jgi:hypothetical protein
MEYWVATGCAGLLGAGNKYNQMFVSTNIFSPFLKV